MKYMLDTNMCIYTIKRHPEKVLERYRALNPSDLCISSITLAELLYGVEKSVYKQKNRLALYSFLSPITVIDYDAKAATEYGVIKAELEKKGTPIGLLDTMIASHAKTLGLTLVTNNVKEFERVENLKIENWV
ncbi:MAG: type II toxin-antitoxin system VapC family toxin [Erysipelotrichaceae bacterium]|nr:type II toxin-antitoxin system VapC family toxin [Erysipelotrichaceae bacterium]